MDHPSDAIPGIAELWGQYVGLTRDVWSERPGLAMAGFEMCVDHAGEPGRAVTDRSRWRLLQGLGVDLLRRSRWQPPRVEPVDVVCGYLDQRANHGGLIEPIVAQLRQSGMRCAALDRGSFRVAGETKDGQHPHWRGPGWSVYTRTRRATLAAWRRGADDWRMLSHRVRDADAPAARLLLRTPRNNIRLLAAAYRAMDSARWLLEQLRPAVLLCTHERYPPCSELIAAARFMLNHEPATAVVQHGLCAYIDMPPLSRTLLLWNQACARGYGLIGDELPEHEVIGNPEVDAVRQQVAAAAKAAPKLRERWAVPPRHRVLLYLSQGSFAMEPAVNDVDDRALRCLVQAASHLDDWTIVVKPHPAYKVHQFDGLGDDPPTNMRIAETRVSLAEAMAAADAICGVFSGGLYVAAGVGKPVIRMLDVPPTYEGALHVLQQVAWRNASSVDELLKALAELPGEPTSREPDPEHYPWPGRSPDRAAEWCRHAVAQHRPPQARARS